jgi:hypothetical protein
MNSKRLVFSFLIFIIPFVFLSFDGKAAEYEITKIIEVGPTDRAPTVWPLKWSPDGTRLAYFLNRSLYISDTLGNSREIIHFDLFPHRYEWLSDNEIIIHLTNYRTESEVNRLVKVDIGNKQLSLLAEYTCGLGIREKNDPNSFAGPFLTVEGRLYYRTNVIRATVYDPEIQSEPMPVIFPESAYPRKTEAPAPEQNHILSWGKDGLYMIKGDLSDSTEIAPKQRHPVKTPIASSKDQLYYMIHSKICNFKDTICISLDTFLIRYTGVIGYDFLYYSFNPRGEEVLFELICEKNENLEKGMAYDERKSYEEFSMATFNYATNRLTILDSLIDLQGCRTPTYAPDGLKIAFLHGGNAHIMYRRIKQ